MACHRQTEFYSSLTLHLLLNLFNVQKILDIIHSSIHSFIHPLAHSTNRRKELKCTHSLSTHMCWVLCLEASSIFITITQQSCGQKSSLLNVICVPHPTPNIEYSNINTTNHMISIIISLCNLHTWKLRLRDIRFFIHHHM